MIRTTTKLDKLRSMSLNEIVGRTQQEVFKLADRILISQRKEMSDARLFREFKSAFRYGSGEGKTNILQRRWQDGIGIFLFQLADRHRLLEISSQRFPDECQAIISSARKVIEGKFDLLGYTDLEFGNPVDWHLDPTTGEHAPLVHWSEIDPVAPIGNGDLKVIWEINRCAHLVTLGQAYRLTHDDRYAAGVALQLSSWIDANPAGIGVGWAASLDVAFRAIQWLWALNLCSYSPAMTKFVKMRMLKSLIEHGCHIEKYLSYYFSPNTHLTGEALGLLYLGVALPELRRAKRWRELGLRILLEQLPRHVREDGVYFEQSSYYHRYTAEFYLHLWTLIRANKIILDQEEERLLSEKLVALLEFLMWIKRPDDTWPLFGDDDGGRLIKFAPRAANDFRDTLAIGAAIFKRGDWKRMAGNAPFELLWLLGAEGLGAYDNLAEEKPQKVSRPFAMSGYFVMRDGWERDSSYALIDCGPHRDGTSCGHAHSDALALELAFGGTTWLVDPATYVYGADAETRDLFRSTRAHNTVMVDGRDQSVTAAPFAWASTASCAPREFTELGDCVVFEGSHDGYHSLADPVTHIRSVLFIPQKTSLILIDKFQAILHHTYTLRFHFAPGCNAELVDHHIEARSPDGSTLIINVFAKAEGLTNTSSGFEAGWVSTCYGQRDSAPVAVFGIEADGPVEITTVILAQADNGND